MSIFDTQHVRSKHDLAWGEDYVLGLVSKTEPITFTRVLELVKKQDVMAGPTTNRYLQQLVKRKLLVKKPDPHDMRLVYFCTTEKGKNIMKELHNAAK